MADCRPAALPGHVGRLLASPRPAEKREERFQQHGLAARQVVEFTGNHRCEDPKLAKKLAALRTSVPSQKLLKKIASPSHRAWKTKEPTEWDILQLDRKTEGKTTVITCSRRGAQLVNELSVEVFFKQRHKKALAELPADWESKSANYDERGRLKKDGPPEPASMQIFKGQRLFLTKNMNKETGFVNGMACVVEAYDARSGCLEVVTRTGARLAVSAIHEHVEGLGRVKYYPIRLGYASTVRRIQGQTLEHATIWLDVAGCKAAGYVALSRVRRDGDYLIAGAVSAKSKRREFGFLESCVACCHLFPCLIRPCRSLGLARSLAFLPSPPLTDLTV